MKNIGLCGSLLLILLPMTVLAADDEQSQLDAVCEAAREVQLAPLRQAQIAECQTLWDKSEAECQHFYRDFGDRTAAGRLAMFYDLPECEKAFEFRTRQRRPD
ncbi:hypothetical protein MPL1_02273 [Methylophaga lonarensis MPL]|uniref:Lipoprotein n=1 Tax=Methylophaga lonarensis MPL TaxID=1286106 RepID=M7PU05_9GAMM|nr:hypothetical protein [Methylophaga lonarensis]EMR13949.1 hypothetical protein MPL1_02273 [Methylophaga lonarensis MPL]